MSQTSIHSSGQPIGVAGQLYDNAEVVDVTSGFSEEASAEIPFGCGVVFGTADDGAKLPAASSDKPKGVVLFSLAHMPAGPADPAGSPTGDLGSTGLKPTSSLQVLRKGRVLVPVEGTVAPGDRPFLRFRTDGATNTQPGTFANAQDNGTNLIDCTRLGQFVSSTFTVNTATGGTSTVAVLEVNFTARNS